MRYLDDKELDTALEIILKTALEALNATCKRSRCGSIIIKDNEIIGRGSNSPPYDLESQRRCTNSKDAYHKKVTDKTCCVHAEQRAILDALRTNPDKLVDARLYFVRVDDRGNATKSEQPYCTSCSKMALDTGIREFVLLHEQGVAVYDTAEYNAKSYAYE